MAMLGVFNQRFGIAPKVSDVATCEYQELYET